MRNAAFNPQHNLRSCTLECLVGGVHSPPLGPVGEDGSGGVCDDQFPFYELCFLVWRCSLMWRCLLVWRCSLMWRCSLVWRWSLMWRCSLVWRCSLMWRSSLVWRCSLLGAAVNTLYKSLFGDIPTSGIAGPYGKHTFNTLKNHHTIFHGGNVKWCCL